MAYVPPQIIFLTGAIFAFFLKGKSRSISNVFFTLSAFIMLVFFTQPQVSYVYSFAGFEMILFNADRISLFVAYVFAFMAIVISIYSMHVKEKVYHAVSMLYIFSAMGMLFAGDFMTFFLFGEIMLIAATVLICYKKEKAALKAGMRYFVIHLIGSSLLLAGILVNYTATESMSIMNITQGVPAILILLGIGVNAAFIPFHTWLPDAYSKAPFTASLLLSVFTTKSAVYALARFFPGVGEVAYMGAAMALFGVVMALLQSDARKLLSYHVISQVGFMVAGVGMGTFLGIDGALYHAFNHILYKSLLFMCIGAVIYRTGKQNLSELGGFARSMPITTLTCIIAALSISGVPLFNGYASKAILYEASYQSILLLWSLKLASLGTFISFCKFTYYGFLRSKDTKVREAPLSMTIPMVTLAVLCIAGGIYPRLVTIFLPYYTDIIVYIPTKVADAMMFTIAAGIIFFLGMKKVFKPHAAITQDPQTDDASNRFSDLHDYTATSLKHFIYARFAKYLPSRLFSKTGADQNMPTSDKNTPALDSSLTILAITIAALLLYITFR